MTKKSKKHSEMRQKHSEDVINELLGEVEGESDLDIESDVANMGEDASDGAKPAESPAEVSERKRRVFFIIALFTILMAIIGIYSSIRFISSGIKALADNTALKTEFARFILPVVANDIAPFEKETEIANTSKVSCSIWNILVNRDTSEYKPSPAGGIYIPEYDVSVSCKDIFGTGATLTHQSVGSGDSRFIYDEENHVYSCPKDLRYLNYAPKITEMKSDNGTYVLTVDYLPPSITMVADDLGLTMDADKTLEYTINRWDKKNTLMSVRLIGGSENL